MAEDVRTFVLSRKHLAISVSQIGILRTKIKKEVRPTQQMSSWSTQRMLETKEDGKWEQNCLIPSRAFGERREKISPTVYHHIWSSCNCMQNLLMAYYVCRIGLSSFKIEHAGHSLTCKKCQMSTFAAPF